MESKDIVADVLNKPLDVHDFAAKVARLLGIGEIEHWGLIEH